MEPVQGTSSTKPSSTSSSSDAAYEKIPKDDSDIELTPLTIEPDDNNVADNTKEEPFSPDASVHSARRILYASHSFAELAACGWQFCLVLILATLSSSPSSLLLVSTYGFCVNLAVFVCVPRLGRWIDASTNRWNVARSLLLGEDMSVLSATLVCFLLLSTTKEIDTSMEQVQRSYDATSIVLLIAVHVLGSFAKVADQAFLVAVERDWIVVMSRAAAGSDESLFSTILSDTNVAMTQIDLTCSIIGPALAGFLIPLVSGDASPSNPRGLRGACLFIGAITLASLIVEYVSSARIYSLVPLLAYKEVAIDDSTTTPIGWTGILSEWCKSFKIYMQQPVALAGIALALLFCNGLNFGNGIMTAHLLFSGMDLETIGIVRGVSSAIGLLGTCVYHLSIRHLSLKMTGMWSVTYQCSCLAVALLSVFTYSGTTSLVLLIGGVCASRIGLWVFDIAVTQMQQEQIPDHVRGCVGGVQQSLNAFFTLIPFVLGIKGFYVYVVAGFSSVALSVLFYVFGTIFQRDQRGDLRSTPVAVETS
jgi:iron-regulated transporter 1